MALKSSVLPVLLVLTAAAVFCSCKKYTDVQGYHDPRLDSARYCNDPDAVNYNWNFPGVVDNTTCFYPGDVFKGNYTFTDSILTSNYARDTERNITFSIIELSRTSIILTGFCGAGGDTIHLTANRYLHADIDSTGATGSVLCRPADTAAGYITRDISDSTHIRFYFTVVSDTGTFLHTGTAVKR